jgi:hypothetical protein
MMSPTKGEGVRAAGPSIRAGSQYFVSVPAWIGYWADAWQQREGRIPARGGMIAAAVGAWVVLAIGIDLVLAYFTNPSTTRRLRQISAQ